MRAWRVHELGDPSKVLSLDEIDQPTPGEGQVLVKVQGGGAELPRRPDGDGDVPGEAAAALHPGRGAVRRDRGDRPAGHRLAVQRARRLRRVRADGRGLRLPGARGAVRREGRLAVPDLPDRVRRAAPPGEHQGRRLAARPRRRRGSGDGGDPARQGRRREGHRHRRRTRARPRSARSSAPTTSSTTRPRTSSRSSRRSPAGTAPTSSTTRSAATSSTRAPSASRSRAGSSSSGSPAAASPRRRPTTCWSRTTASSACTGGCTGSTTRRSSAWCTSS